MRMPYNNIFCVNVICQKMKVPLSQNCQSASLLLRFFYNISESGNLPLLESDTMAKEH